MYGGKSVVGQLLTLAILLSGLCYHQVAQAARFIGLQLPSPSSFFRLQKMYEKTITKFFNVSISNAQAGAPAKVVAVDTRYDSPGFCASKSTTIFMNMDDANIIHATFGDHRMTNRSSPNMEEMNFRSGMDTLLQLDVQEIVTDASSKVKSVLEEPKYDHVHHSMDLWHKGKRIAELMTLVWLPVSLRAAGVIVGQTTQFPYERHVQWRSDPSYADGLPHSSPDNQTFLTLEDCAGLCASTPSCSSFFYHHNQSGLGECLLYSVIFADVDYFAAHKIDWPNTEYFRIVPDDCDMDKCFYSNRRQDLCLFLSVDSNLNCNQVSEACRQKNASLPVLNTAAKIEWVSKLLASHMSESSATIHLDFKRANRSILKWNLKHWPSIFFDYTSPDTCLIMEKKSLDAKAQFLQMSGSFKVSVLLCQKFAGH